MIKIGNTLITKNSPPYVISEIGLNHNGDVNEAKRLILDSKEAGCNAVKFQLRSDLFFKSKIETMEIGQQYVYQYIKETYLNFEDYKNLFEFAEELGLDLLVSCWDLKSLEFADKSGVKTLKIASADLTNKLLISESLKIFKNIIMSTGMSTQKEIENCVAFILNNSNSNLCLLHCSSTYPAPVNTLNLQYIARLKENYKDLIIGYSGHELEYEVCMTAQAFGATIFEKHITSNKNQTGNDHKVSLVKSEMENLVKILKNGYLSKGNSRDREIQPGEKMNRVSLGKSLSLNKNLKAGHRVLYKDFDFTYGGSGIPPDQFQEIKNKTLLKDKEVGEAIQYSDFKEFYNEDYQKISPLGDNPMGIPVRYHDAKILYEEIKPDFLEFHLSYKDICLSPDHVSNLICDIKTDIDNTFHAPDFYDEDLIFNPLSDDKQIMKKSDSEFRNFLSHVMEILKVIPNKKKTKIITSFSCPDLYNIYTKDVKDELYIKLIEYLRIIEKDFPQLQILPQTLPLNAWYLGGRRFVNIFANPIEILDFCKRYKVRICLDTAHTIMACNAYKLEINKFLFNLLDYTDHIHLVDAKGESDEGLNFGQGDLNLVKFAKELKKFKKISFIPEIWQGHHNLGQGFKDAIYTLFEKCEYLF